MFIIKLLSQTSVSCILLVSLSIHPTFTMHGHNSLKLAPTCFGSQRTHHQGALYSAWLNITRMILSFRLTWTCSVLWQHIVTRCACVQFTVYEGTVRVCRSLLLPSYTVNYNSVFIYSELHTRTTVTTCCHNTDHVHVNGHDRIIL